MARVACIDIGTVTCRLAIANIVDGKVVALKKTSQICSLGEDLAESGRLARAAIDRVGACIHAYVNEIATTNVAGTCCTLTSAARDASNSSELTNLLASYGLRPQIIPGTVEAALTFAGVAHDYPNTPLIVADNGGGSTELATGILRTKDGIDVACVESVDVGCRRITDLFLSTDMPDSKQQRAAAHSYAYDLLKSTALKAREALPNAKTLVVCGGTVTSLVAMREELVPYDSTRVHGATLSADEVRSFEHRLAALPVSERANIPGLQAKRAPVIVGGIIVIAELLHATGFTTLTVSEHDLLYGLALSAAAVIDGTPLPTSWEPELVASVAS